MNTIEDINTINREEEGMQQEQEEMDIAEDLQREDYEDQKAERETDRAEEHYSPSEGY